MEYKFKPTAFSDDVVRYIGFYALTITKKKEIQIPFEDIKRVHLRRMSGVGSCKIKTV